MRSRILYITHRVPWPPDRGDRIRTWNVLKYLSTRADVDLACLADEPVSETTLEQLKRVTQRLSVIPHEGKWRYFNGLCSLLRGQTATEGLFASASLRRQISRWDGDEVYDAVLASSSGIAPLLFPPVMHQHVRHWVDLIDVDSQKWFDYAQAAGFPMSFIYQLEGKRLRLLEQQLATQCDQLLVVSEAERELFQSFCPDGPVMAVGNGVDANYFSSFDFHSCEEYSCVFVGVMDYQPNVDAVMWFAEHVWPQLHERFPTAVFRIVGKSPVSAVRALALRPGIEVTGAVADVRPWLCRSACAVVPLRIARGVQNKVLEAMSCGRPVICSPAPLQGLAAEPGLHLLRAESPAEWIDAVSRVFADLSLREELGMAGSAFVQLNHSWEHCLSRLDQLLEPREPSGEKRVEVAS